MTTRIMLARARTEARRGTPMGETLKMLRELVKAQNLADIRDLNVSDDVVATGRSDRKPPARPLR